MKKFSGLFVVFIVGLTLIGCGSSQEELVVYSGRSQPLVDGLVEQFNQEHDLTVKVKYGKDAQLLAALREEGSQSPADVYWANTTGALTNAAQNDLLEPLPETLRSKPERFVPESGAWVPITTRFRILAYNSNSINPEQLPDSVLDLPSVDGLQGRVGWTPTYSSFQDFLTILRTKEGEEAARQWLRSMSGLNPKSYSSNTPMIRALAAGEIDVALTNHYYVLGLKHGGAEGEYEEEEHEEEKEEEEGPRPSAPVETYRFSPGDAGNLAMVTGAGILSSSDQPEIAREFLEFLLSETAQSFAAEQVNEYPVVSGTSVPDYMIPAEEALELSPDFQPSRLQELDTTLDMLRQENIL